MHTKRSLSYYFFPAPFLFDPSTQSNSHNNAQLLLEYKSLIKRQKRPIMFPRSLQISWLLAAITVHSHPQSLFPGSDNSAMFDRLRLDKFFDILNPSTGLENSEDLSRTPYIANSYFDDSAPTAAPKVATPPDDLGIDPVSQGSGTDLAYNSLQNASGGSGVSPILPWSLSPIDQSSATTSDSDAPDANISLAPETKDFGVGGGAGSGGGGGGELPPVFFIPLAAPQGPILSPGTTSRPAGVPYWERHGPHEEDSDKPDCPHFPGNLRVLFCCPRTSDSKIPPIAKNPTRQANCFLCML